MNITAGGEPKPGCICQPSALVPLSAAITGNVSAGPVGVVPVPVSVLDDAVVGVEMGEVIVPLVLDVELAPIKVPF